MITKALSFSGGKDSLACLYLLQPIWHELIVVWCNTGNAHPSTIAMMDRVRAMVPHFHEVKSNQPEFIAKCGYPTEILPTNRTPFGQELDSRKGRKFIDWQTCCATNIWIPLHCAMMDLGVTTIFRGQKRADMIRSPMKNGHIENGVA